MRLFYLISWHILAVSCHDQVKLSNQTSKSTESTTTTVMAPMKSPDSVTVYLEPSVKSSYATLLSSKGRKRRSLLSLPQESITNNEIALTRSKRNTISMNAQPKDKTISQFKLKIFPEYERPIRKKLHDAFVLTCQPKESRSNVTIKWFFNGEEVLSSNTSQRKYLEFYGNKTLLSLRMTSVKIEDFGNYTCEGTWKNQTVSESVELIHDKPLEILSNANQSGVVGQNADVMCEFNCSDEMKCSMTWKFSNQTNIEAGEKYNVETHKLTIKNVQLKDTDKYICDIVILTPLETEAYVIDFTALQEPIIKNDPSQNEVSGWNGHVSELTCQAEANPLATIKWYRPDTDNPTDYSKAEEITSGTLYTVDALSTDGDLFMSSSSLHVNIEEDSSLEVSGLKNKTVYGDYLCHAINSVNSTWHTLTLKEMTRLDTPVIKTNTDDFIPGSDAQLNCTIIKSSIKNMTFKWFHNEDEIPGEESNLYTVSPKTGHEGSYTCKAVIFGIAVSNESEPFVLEIEYITIKPERPIIKENRSHDPDLGSSVVLDCTITGQHDNVVKFKWFHNNIPIQKEESSRLILTSLNEKNEGSFSCQVIFDTERSNRSEEFVLTVKGEPMSKTGSASGNLDITIAPIVAVLVLLVIVIPLIVYCRKEKSQKTHVVTNQSAVEGSPELAIAPSSKRPDSLIKFVDNEELYASGSVSAAPPKEPPIQPSTCRPESVIMMVDNSALYSCGTDHAG